MKRAMKLLILFLGILMIMNGKDNLSNAFVGCNLKTVNDYFEANEHWLSYGDINIYKKNNNYYIFISKSWKIIRMGVINEKRKWLYMNNLRYINVINNYNYDSSDFKQILLDYGKDYFDIGNGFWIPAYITENGELLYFHISKDNTIYSVTKLDIFTKNEKILYEKH